MKAAILGFGTVGSGVYQVLIENEERTAHMLGEPIQLAYVLDLRDFPGHPVENLLTKDYTKIVEDPSVDLIIECMGGIHPSYDFIKMALEKGKCVVTSNKELVAACGAELMKVAYENKTDFLFEASVGGGIPVLRTLRHGLAQEKIISIQGILNGTTNYILTRMEQEGLPYETVLADAQALGYAERNPEADVMGLDACRKLAILASMVSGKNVSFEEIPTEGITGITLQDMEEAEKQNKKIRLIAEAVFEEDGIKAKVGPKWVDSSHPLAVVHGVYNAVLVSGNMVGNVLLEGQGAGSKATASAVVADAMEALMDRKNNYCEPILWTEEPAHVIVE